MSALVRTKRSALLLANSPTQWQPDNTAKCDSDRSANGHANYAAVCGTKRPTDRCAKCATDGTAQLRPFVATVSAAQQSAYRRAHCAAVDATIEPPERTASWRSQFPTVFAAVRSTEWRAYVTAYCAAQW